MSANTRRAYAGALGRRGRGVESERVAAERGRLEAVIAGLLFMGGLRLSEVSALRWADVADDGAASVQRFVTGG